MSEIVNLNRARKRHTREQNRKQAEANAVNYGRTKAERIADAARSANARQMLDQHRLDEE